MAVRDWLGSGNVSARTFAERIIARAVGQTKIAIQNDPVLAPDVAPKLLGLALDFDPLTGVATLSWTGDSYTQSVSILVSLSGIPSDAATRPGGTADTQVINGQSGSYSWVGYPAYTTPPNNPLYAAAWAYSTLNGNALDDGLEAKQKATTVQIFSPTATPQGTINVHVGGIYDILAQGPPGTASWKYAINVGAAASAPSLAAARSGTTVTPGTPRELSLLNQGPATYGDKIVGRFIPYAGAGGTGEEYPSIVLTGAYQNTAATKYDTFPGSCFPSRPGATGYTVDPSQGTIAFDPSNHATTPFTATAIRTSSGLTFDSLYFYGLLTFPGGGSGTIYVGLWGIPQGTLTQNLIATVATISSSGSPQLVSSGTGLGVVADTQSTTYYCNLGMDNPNAAGVCVLYSFTIGYIQNTVSQGL